MRFDVFTCHWNPIIGKELFTLLNCSIFWLSMGNIINQIITVLFSPDTFIQKISWTIWDWIFPHNGNKIIETRNSMSTELAKSNTKHRNESNKEVHLVLIFRCDITVSNWRWSDHKEVKNLMCWKYFLGISPKICPVFVDHN